MKSLIKKLYHNPFFQKVFPTMVYCLQKELLDCETVLDLGCGPDSPLQYCTNVKKSVGVEPFHEYMQKSKEKGIHNEYICSTIENLNFEEGHFDAVILMEVLEHLDEETGCRILDKANMWAKKKVILSTPNGFINQNAVDGNEWQKHLSGWDVKKLQKMGFKCYGLAGFKFLRSEKDEDTMDDNLLVSIKYKPKFFWFIIASLSQALTYYLPNLSFGLFCVKTKN